MLSYFPDRLDAAQFLRLIHTWWITSNSKARYHHNKLGNAAVPNDQKPQFLRAFANWLAEWKCSAIPNCEKFQLSKQTSDAMIQTLRCHASLIEDLLNSGSYEFICTAKFQSDPIERRFSQYRQMSGGRFLVALKEVNSSEKILKIKALLKSNCDLEATMSTQTSEDRKLALEDINQKISATDINALTLSNSTREVSDLVAGYVAKKIKPFTETCCSDKLIGECDNAEYIKLLSRGGLLEPSVALSDAVGTSFAILDFFEVDIQKCPLQTREAAEYILDTCLLIGELSCVGHADLVRRRILRITTNVFFNNHCKRKSEQQLEDKMKVFKKLKREKRS